MADIRRLPRPVADNWTWQMRAACRELDNAVFFHPEGERGIARFDREARAKRVCRACPVIDACRRYAVTVQEPYGVWGGMSVDERAAVIEASGARAR
ncbi:WhiB family transcriptional regulator [Pseudonocardia sp. GCM10023141]|uniref:WhiB family transcriptional regulator n=1 Tax=Pseudonocardia sp. GCM10023141 TaxID=3252653 RepID=UPI00361D3A64